VNEHLTFDLSQTPIMGVENLRNVKWVEGEFALMGVNIGPRHAFVAAMTSQGNREAAFSDGEKHEFFRMLALIHPKTGVLQIHGGHTVPMFPNGDLLTVVVHRQALAAYDSRSTVVHRTGCADLDIGSTYSLELPGGSIDPGEGLDFGAIREMLEETGIKPGSTVDVVERTDVVHLLVSEIILAEKIMIVHLPDVDFPDYVENDGGLRVVRISRADLRLNHFKGLATTSTTTACLEFLDDFALYRKDMLRYGAAIERKMKLV